MRNPLIRAIEAEGKRNGIVGTRKYPYKGLNDLSCTRNQAKTILKH